MSKSHKREPVSHSCPDIDSVLGKLHSIEKLCNYKDNEDIDELQLRLSEIGDEFRGRWDRDIENIRECNSKLREWGSEEANRVDELEGIVYDLEKEIESLKEEIEILNSQS